MQYSNAPQNIIGIDVGYGNTKVVCGHDLTRSGTNKWVESIFPSITKPITASEAQAGLGDNPERILIEHEGKFFYTGKRATSGVVPRVQEVDYIRSTMHEVLLRTALHLAMREHNRVITDIDMLMLGLPVSNFAKNRKHLQELGMREREVPVPKALMRAGTPEKVIVRARRVEVLPQPLGALRLAAHSLPATDDLFEDGTASMVIDPGYRTLDWLVSNSFRPEMVNSGSCDGGVSNILREIGRLVGLETGRGSPEFDTIEQGLKRGSINFGDTIVDMKKYQAMLPVLTKDEVGAFLNRIHTSRNSISHVILTGGGADYYKKAVADALSTAKIHIQDDAVMSNARGYWLAGCDVLAESQ